jgi:hypothetical protein
VSHYLLLNYSSEVVLRELTCCHVAEAEVFVSVSGQFCPDQKRVVSTKLTAIPLDTPISFKALLFLASHFTFVNSK